MFTNLLSFKAGNNNYKNLTCLIILFLVNTCGYSQIREITFKDVQEIADRNAHKLWGDIGAATPIPYYGPDDEIIAYHFNYAINKEFPESTTLMEECNAAFNEGNRNLGWGVDMYANLVVGARPYMPVIIEYSKCLSKQFAMGSKLNDIALKEFGNNFEFGKTYYLGLVDVWFCIKQGDIKKYVNLEPKIKVLNENEFTNYADSKQLFWKRDNFESDWIKFLENKGSLDKGTIYIPGREYMPFLEWSLGCTPTSAAMHLAWWDNYHNYGNLIDYYATLWDPIQENFDHHVPSTQCDLAIAMETSGGSTDAGKVSEGYIEVVEERGYNCSSDGHYALTWTVEQLFDDVKGEIDNQRPLHVCIDNHSLVGIGYSNINKTVDTHDPNMSTVRTITRAMLVATYWVNISNNYGTFVDLESPHGGKNWNGQGGNQEIVNSNDYMEISWASNYDPDTYVKLYYHDEGGFTLDRWFLITENTPNDGTYDWHIPEIDCYYGNTTNYARVKIEVYNQLNQLIASDGSYGNFDINDNGGLPELMGLELATTNPDYFSIPLAEEWWMACGIRDNNSMAFWFIELYDDVDFSTMMEESHTWEYVNYIVLNGHNAPLQEYGIKVMNYWLGQEADIHYEINEDYLFPNTTTNLTWNADHVVKMWDIHLTPGNYFFEMDFPSTSLDLDIALFKWGGDNVFSRTDYVAASLNLGFGVGESFCYSVLQEGDYGICVSSKSNDAGNFSITISDAQRWIGSTSSNWHNPANWATGEVPSFDDNVIIPSGCLNNPRIIAQTAYCNSLTIESGASLEVSNEYFNVLGDLKIFGELKLSSEFSNLTAENSISWENGSIATILHDDAVINCYKSWYFKEGANVNLTQGTVQFVSAHPSFILNCDDNSSFNDILIDKTTGSFQYHLLSTHDLIINGDLKINSGSNFGSSSEKTIILGGDLNVNGTITLDNGTFKLIGDPKFIDVNIGDYFHNLDISTSSNCLLYSDLQLQGDMLLHSGGIVTLGDIYVKGSWHNFGGTALFGENTNKVVFNGNGKSYIYGEEFYTLELNGSCELYFQSGITSCQYYDWVNGNLLMIDGTVNINDLVDNGLFGTIIVEGGTLNIHQDAGQYADLNCELYLNGGNVRIFGGTGSSYWGAEADAEIVVEDGILDFTNMGIRLYNSPTYNLGGEINGGLIRTAGSVICDEHNINIAGGTFEFYGAAPAYLQSASEPFYHINIDKNTSDGMKLIHPVDPRDNFSKTKSPKNNNVDLSSNITINGDLTVTSGTLNCASHTVTINGDLLVANDGILNSGDGLINIFGDWTNNHGTEGFIEGTGTVVFLGSTTSYIYTDETFYNLESNKTGTAYDYVWIENNLVVTVLNDLNIGGCSFRLGDDATLNINHDLIISENSNLMACPSEESYIYIGNNWFNYNTTGYPWAYGFYYGESIVTFNSLDDQFVEAASGTQEFYNLVVDKASGWFMPIVNITVYRDADILEGSWNQDATGLIFSFHGSLFIDNNGSWDDNINLVRFAGPDPQFFTNYGSNNLNFRNIYVVKETEGSSNPTVYFPSVLPCYHLWIQEGNVELYNDNIECDYRVQISEGGKLTMEGNSNIRMADMGTIMVGGGELNIIGSPTSYPRITHLSGYYALSVYAGGVLSANKVIFEYMNTNGVYVYNNGLIDDVNSLNNCTFRNGQPGGSLLRFATTQSINIENAVFPENTWGSNYNVNKTFTSGEINFINATGDFSGEAFENDPNDLVNWEIPGFDLNVRVYLEGPFNGSLMNFDLMPEIPLNQPYNAAPWNYNGTESVSTLPGKTVDWVLVELRDAPSAALATSGTVIARQAAFVKNNGYILDLEGTQSLQFSQTINDQLFLVIWHRNHLPVMSAYPLVEIGGVYYYDFSTSEDKAYGNADAHKEIAPGIFGMIGGDTDLNGVVNSFDKGFWDVHVGERGYLFYDFNLDSEVDNQDKNDVLIPNYGRQDQVPN